MRFFLMIAAIVLFVVSALVFFFIQEADVSFRVTMGLVCVGLACIAAALTPASPNV